MKVLLLAGEPSGDKLAAALMRGLKTLAPDVEFRGIAGPLMQAEGMVSNFPMEELSVMGLAEVLPKYRHLKRRIEETAEDAIAWNPDVVISVDSPDFSFRVARRIKARTRIRTVHYVAPTVWAWRPKRAEKLAKVIDHVLALFPFEPPYFEREGVECDFVGHPVVSEPPVAQEDIAAFRADHNVTGPCVALLPGSRRSEVERMMEGLLASLDHVKWAEPPHIIVPTLPHLGDTVRRLMGRRDAIILDGSDRSADDGLAQRRLAMAASDVALAASGTVSLELASVRTPMVIAYDMNWMSRAIIQRMLLIDTVTLVNLVAESRTVEEFIGREFQPGPIAEALQRLMDDPNAQLAAMETCMTRLGEADEDPGLRAARAVIARLG